MVCDYRPLKDEPYRIRLTVGGDKLDYFGETASPIANLLETKLLINSVISDAHKGARFFGIDIKDFFLLSSLPADQKEYIRVILSILMKNFESCIILHHSLRMTAMFIVRFKKACMASNRLQF